MMSNNQRREYIVYFYHREREIPSYTSWYANDEEALHWADQFGVRIGALTGCVRLAGEVKTLIKWIDFGKKNNKKD